MTKKKTPISDSASSLLGINTPPLCLRQAGRQTFLVFRRQGTAQWRDNGRETVSMQLTKSASARLPQRTERPLFCPKISLLCWKVQMQPFLETTRTAAVAASAQSEGRREGEGARIVVQSVNKATLCHLRVTEITMRYIRNPPLMAH